MKIDINSVETNFVKIVESLISGEEKEIIITKDNVPLIQMSPIINNNQKRLGIAKDEMKDFDISLEDFNDISTPDFGL